MSVNETKQPLPPVSLTPQWTFIGRSREARIWGLYARVRAVFVESIIAELVDGEMILNPNSAWDVNMPLAGWQRPVRIQIKCSGGRLARWPDKIIPASWEVDGPKKGRDEEFEDLGRGYHCDVFVSSLVTRARTSTGAGTSTSSRRKASKLLGAGDQNDQTARSRRTGRETLRSNQPKGVHHRGCSGDDAS